MSVLPIPCSVKLLHRSRSVPGPKVVKVTSLAVARKPGTLHHHLPITVNNSPEVERIAARVERLAEKQKLVAKLKGNNTLTEEDMAVVETMCREIVNKFFQPPIQYLMVSESDAQNFDMEILTRLLQEP